MPSLELIWIHNDLKYVKKVHLPCYRIYVLSRLCRILLVKYMNILYLRQLEYLFLN